MDAPLQDLGIDSMGAVEFRNELQVLFDVELSVTTLFDYPTLNGIIDYICSEIAPKAKSAPLAASQQHAGLTTPPGGASSQCAVVGMACRFPGGSNGLQAFWQMLVSGADCVQHIPVERFNIDQIYDPDTQAEHMSYVREAAMCDNAAVFDNSFFSIPLLEAQRMDPQQRMMMEVAYECLLSSGQQRASLLGSDSSVFIGCCQNDWGFVQVATGKGGSYSATGASMSLLSNRISYVFGTTGPSVTVDTACSASLVAADVAMQYLRSGCTGLAVVGGTNLFLTTIPFIACCQARMLAPDGRSKTFDSRADGYGRGEGVGAVALRTVDNLSGAELKDVWAVVQGSAVNHDGRSASLTAPNGPSQQAVIRTALRKAGLDPSAVSIVETHGTGTHLGDPIETGALKAVYGPGRKWHSPLVLGAIKSQIGHTEGTAGMAGLIKLVISLRLRVASPNAHLQQLNPYVDLADFPTTLPSKPVSLQSQCGHSAVVIGAVSSFGFGGANVHCVVSSPEEPLTPELLGPTTAFVFSGEGANVARTGETLYSTEAEFRRAVDVCDMHAKHHVGSISLLEMLYSEKNMAEVMDNELCLFAVEYALACLLMSKGLRPRLVLGYGLGEYVAAVIAGVMTVSDAIRLLAKRLELSRPDVSGTTIPTSTWKSTEQGFQEVKKQLLLQGRSVEEVRVAAIHSSNELILRGPAKALEELHAFANMPLESPVSTSKTELRYNFLLEGTAAVEDFRAVAADVEFRECPSSIRFVSGCTGEVCQPVGSDYWTKHFMNPVRFSTALEAVLLEKVTVVVEVGPAPSILTAMTRQCMGDKAVCVSAMDPMRSDTEAIERAVACGSCGHTWEHKSFPWVADFDVSKVSTDVYKGYEDVERDERTFPENITPVQDMRDFIKSVVIEAVKPILQSGDLSEEDNLPLDTHLMELGIDSLGAVSFRNEINERLGVRLSLDNLKGNPTLTGIIDFLHAHRVATGGGEHVLDCFNGEVEQGRPTLASSAGLLAHVRDSVQGSDDGAATELPLTESNLSLGSRTLSEYSNLDVAGQVQWPAFLEGIAGVSGCRGRSVSAVTDMADSFIQALVLFSILLCLVVVIA
eukprot:GHVS01030425.1.p1 GENE.GHVS01030425.1~~GHVS01030425.1.p1  ORF type:complete len:1255 (-),score=145.88 GHVS01030425.1:27-3305(-)